MMNKITPLSQWMIALEDGAIAVGSQGEISRADFYTDVARYKQILDPHPGRRWAVYHHDAYVFLVILCALWQLQRTACIPGDNCLATQRRLGEHVDGFIGDFAESIELSNDLLLVEPTTFNILAPTLAALEVYTSGSTGEPKAIVKTVAQLEDEVATLESFWPSRSNIIATVSHQHFYGIIFRLFWPISCQRLFFSKMCLYVEEIQQQTAQCEHFTLIASPTHLSRFGSLLDWPEVAKKCEAVISSAAPLHREDSLNISTLLDAPVREVYGSSETGAIAWRHQSNDVQETFWHALPGVTLVANTVGVLCCESSYNESLEQITLADKAVFSAQGFVLAGRVDRITKIEGKRLSLNAMEQCIESNALVKLARVLPLQKKRTEVAAVIILTESGRASLHSKGKRALTSILKQQLMIDFEAVLLPRRWRFVETLPYNPQGKLIQSDLELIFEKQLNKWPEVTSVTKNDLSLTLQCKLTAELIYFDGHFEDNPILPGVVQIHWAQAFAKEHSLALGNFSHLEKIKFQKVIQPLDTVALTLSFDTAKNRLHFCYSSAKGDHSSGYICFKH